MLLELYLFKIKEFTYSNLHVKYIKILMLTYVEFSQFKLEKRSIPIRLTLLDRNSMFVVSNSF